MPVITIAMHSTTEEVKKNLIEGLDRSRRGSYVCSAREVCGFCRRIRKPTPSASAGARSRQSRQHSKVQYMRLPKQPDLTGRGLPGGGGSSEPVSSQLVPALGFPPGHFHSSNGLTQHTQRSSNCPSLKFHPHEAASGFPPSSSTQPVTHGFSKLKAMLSTVRDVDRASCKEGKARTSAQPGSSF